MEQETKLPEGLELAQLCCAHASFTGVPDADARTAHEAIRAEHAQRLTMQHHAADMAQRVADLEKERDEWRQLASAYSPAKELTTSLKQAEASGDAARKERDELRARLAELERQEPVAWVEHDHSGTGQKRLHFARRMVCLRDEVINPVWTALYARPVPAAPEHKA